MQFFYKRMGHEDKVYYSKEQNRTEFLIQDSFRIYLGMGFITILLSSYGIIPTSKHILNKTSRKVTEHSFWKIPACELSTPQALPFLALNTAFLTFLMIIFSYYTDNFSWLNSCKVCNFSNIGITEISRN